MATPLKIGFLGAGKMATALARGFINAKLVKPGQLSASDPYAAARDHFTAETGAKTAAGNLEIARAANVLILASGGRSSAKTEQRTGRVLRAFAGKSHGIIYDFLDKPSTMMSNHAKKRLATYRALGYSIQMP